MREVIAYEFDDFSLDVKKQELLKNGDSVPITHKAFQILLILVQNFEQTVEKENIYQQLWADSFVEDANLTQHIYILRKTLGKNPAGEVYIETVARTGYRFKAQVITRYAPSVVPMPEVVSRPRIINGKIFRAREGGAQRATQLKLAPHSFSSNEPDADDAPLHESEPPALLAGLQSNKKYFIAAVAVAAFVLAIAIGVAFYIRDISGTQSPQTVKSLAVLPLKPIGDESRNEKLGLGMADAIITQLSKLQQIPVRPTSSVIRYTDQPAESSLAAGIEMGVDTVLEGTVQRDNDRVRVSVQLIDVSNGKTVWAENFDENFTNIFSVQDSISTKVVRALEVNLTQQQEWLMTRPPTTSTEAFQAYQLGVYFGSTRSKENMVKAVDYFNKAIELDPNYAKAYALLADTYNMIRYYRHTSEPVELRKKALEAVKKSIELNSDNAEAYIALAFLQPPGEAGQQSAKELLELAIERSPYNSTARVRYAWIIISDDLDSAVQQMRLAQEYDPLSGVSNGALCNVLTFQRKYDEAVKYGEKAVEISPESPSVRILLSDAYFLSGRHEDAIGQVKKRIDEAKGVEKSAAEGSLAYYYAKMGRRAEAEKIYARLKHLVKENPKENLILLNDLTVIAYALDKKNEGFEYFRQVYDRRFVQPTMLTLSPIWQDVYADERVKQILSS